MVISSFVIWLWGLLSYLPLGLCSLCNWSLKSFCWENYIAQFLFSYWVQMKDYFVVELSFLKETSEVAINTLMHNWLISSGGNGCMYERSWGLGSAFPHHLVSAGPRERISPQVLSLPIIKSGIDKWNLQNLCKDQLEKMYAVVMCKG